MAYSEKVLDHFYNPRNVGVIKGASGMGKVNDSACGDIIRLYVQIENEVVVDAKFQAYGSPATIAVSSVASEIIKDKKLEELLQITKKQIKEELGELPQTKTYAYDLAVEAIYESVLDYERKLKGEKKPRKKQIRKSKKQDK